MENLDQLVQSANQAVADAITINAAFPNQRINQFVNSLHNHLLQFLQASRFLTVRDACDYVRVVIDLPIVVTGLRQNSSFSQIQELDFNRRGADIQGDGIMAVSGIARFNIC